MSLMHINLKIVDKVKMKVNHTWKRAVESQLWIKGT